MRPPPYSPERVAAVLGTYSVVVFLAAIIWAAAQGSPDSIPDYAMKSGLIFRAEQALVFAALLILPAAVVALPLAGLLPTKIGKEGVEWKKAGEEIANTLEDHQQRLDNLQRITDLLSRER